MLNSLKYFLKRYKLYIFIAFSINLPLILIGTIRTNMGVISKGDTVKFNSVVNIDTNYNEAGSFSTIYVMDIEGSTPFMNLIAKYDSNMELYELNLDYELSLSESYYSGKIMYASSIKQAIISAYSLANKDDSNIKLEYEFDGYYITYKNKNSDFNIGDNIYGIKRAIKNGEEITYSDIYYKDSNEYLEYINDPKVDDIYLVEESDKINSDYSINKTGIKKEIKLKSGDSFSKYPIYNINLENTSPKISFNSNLIGGPSGGLLQTLSIYNRLTEFDYTNGLKISGTGTINSNTLEIGEIGGIEEKIPTAIDDGIDIFFCPEENYNDAYNKYIKIKNHEKMKLVKVKNLYEAIDYLKNIREV